MTSDAPSQSHADTPTLRDLIVNAQSDMVYPGDISDEAGNNIVGFSNMLTAAVVDNKQVSQRFKRSFNATHELIKGSLQTLLNVYSRMSYEEKDEVLRKIVRSVINLIFEARREVISFTASNTLGEDVAEKWEADRIKESARLHEKVEGIVLSWLDDEDEALPVTEIVGSWSVMRRIERAHAFSLYQLIRCLKEIRSYAKLRASAFIADLLHRVLASRNIESLYRAIDGSRGASGELASELFQERLDSFISREPPRAKICEVQYLMTQMFNQELRCLPQNDSPIRISPDRDGYVAWWAPALQTVDEMNLGVLSTRGDSELRNLNVFQSDWNSVDNAKKTHRTSTVDDEIAHRRRSSVAMQMERSSKGLSSMKSKDDLFHM